MGEQIGALNARIAEGKQIFEVMKIPKIITQEEKGVQLLSILLKLNDLEFGEIKNPIKLSIETSKYFRENPIDPKILETIQEFYKLIKKEKLDEETLYNLALTYQHVETEREKEVFKMIAKDKEHVENPTEIQEKLLGVLEKFNTIFSASPLAEKFAIHIETDIKERLEIAESTKKRIEKLIDFFKPDSATTKINKVFLIPTDPIYKKESGGAFVLGEELILHTNIENTDNLEHEFSHSIINPIVEKLSEQLNDEQKEKISRFASGRLKHEEEYGEGYFSLLCEEIIRTYNDVFKKGKKPRTHEDFVQIIFNLSEGQFKEKLLGSKSFKKRCESLDIKTKEDLINKSKEFFERFEESLLRELIFQIYEEYDKREDKESINFEMFLLENFKNKLNEK